ncbi:MAG TPA: hypothetical protein VJT31_39485 [Rugosimonospora sp.]|nr:hypothetical protein [Rugosimonospora sp.]
MRCADLTGTWSELRAWFDARNVLVLPRLTGNWPVVQLDGDLAPDRPATGAEVASVVERLRQVVDRFAVPAVYVGTVAGESGAELSGVTIRVMAGGILHELTLTAAWYAGYDIDVEQVLVPVGG